MNLRIIGSECGNVSRGTKVFLDSEIGLPFKDFDDKPVDLPKGTYYITGFWANACGLTTRHRGETEYYLPYGALALFKREVL